MENQRNSPNTQRTILGSAKSACVPCRVAHLRYIMSQISPTLSCVHILTVGRCNGA